MTGAAAQLVEIREVMRRTELPGPGARIGVRGYRQDHRGAAPRRPPAARSPGRPRPYDHVPHGPRGRPEHSADARDQPTNPGFPSGWKQNGLVFDGAEARHQGSRIDGRGMCRHRGMAESAETG